jgi:hypothetical protein
MRFELVELMIILLSWMWDLPVDLYPGAPPSVQIRGKPATNPLNRGISQQTLISVLDAQYYWGAHRSPTYHKNGTGRPEPKE